MAASLVFPMRQEPVTRAATSKSFFIYMSGPTGLAVTGLAFNTTGLIASYAGSLLARVAITLADLAAITTAWASGGFKEVDATNMPGWYRIDVPNAALALAVDEVVVSIRDLDGTGDAGGTLIIPIPTRTVATAEAKVDTADTVVDSIFSAIDVTTGDIGDTIDAIAGGIPNLDVVSTATVRTDF